MSRIILLDTVCINWKEFHFFCPKSIFEFGRGWRRCTTNGGIKLYIVGKLEALCIIEDIDLWNIFVFEKATNNITAILFENFVKHSHTFCLFSSFNPMFS